MTGLEPVRAFARQILMVLYIGAAPIKITGCKASVVSTNSTTPAYKI